MYAGGTYLSRYCCEYIKKEKRIRIGKRIIAAAAALSFAGIAIMLPNRLLHVTASSGLDSMTGKGAKAVLSGSILSGSLFEEAALTNLASQTMEEINILAAQPKTPVVFIDAGHGGEDGGCVKKGVLEKDINLEIAKLVQSKLQDLGYDVIMAREDDTFITKEDRVELANDSKADIYISIHQNSSDDTGVSGMEVWYDETDVTRDNKRLAQLVRQQTAKSTQAVERELRGNADFHVTGYTSMPACLIETGFLTNAKERGKLVTAEYQDQIASGIVEGIDYYFHPKTMYLTFDDGPSEENTAQILDILKERKIKATFFLIGENVRKYPEIARRIVAEGHSIGIHCDIHNYDTLYASADSYIQDFEAAHKTVYEVTGVDTKLFRFPGGSVNDYNEKIRDEMIEKMTEKGYIYYDWNAGLEDAAKGAKVEDMVASGVDSTLGRKKVILLAHDVVYNTSLCLNDLLDSLPEYEMLPLSEDVEPIRFIR